MTRAEAIAEIERSIQAAVEAQARLVRLREATLRAQSVRDALVRSAALLGAQRTTLAESIGINRASLYQILNQPDDLDDSWWEHLADQHEVAVSRWERNGQQGDPDDYWPL